MTRRTYRVVWAPAAKRALERLPGKASFAANEFVYGPLSTKPEQAGKPLRHELEGMHSAHRGDFRILYRIDMKRRVVHIDTIRHRSDVYRRR